MINVDRRLLWQDEQTFQPRPSRIPIPKVFKFTGLIFIGFFIVTASLVLVSRSADIRFNLLDTYADILPGHPLANVGAYGFECSLYQVGIHNNVEECLLRPTIGIFSRISVVRYNDVIDSVIFRPRENALALGEVALALGAQSSRQRSPNNHWC